MFPRQQEMTMTDEKIDTIRKTFIVVHFPGDNVPVYIRKDEVVKFHAIAAGTCVFMMHGQAVQCLESPDEIIEQLLT